jgi:hypothetical protein
VLYNLKELYCNPPPSPSTSGCVPYTRVGDIVIALNPFVWMKDLYSTRKQAYYADALIWSIPPPMAKRPSMELITDATLTLPSITTEIKLHATDTRLHESSPSSREGINTIFKPPEELTPKAASFFTRAKYYSPHIYETTALAFRSMIYHHKNQTILVSGESGASKTETVKLCMSHLAFIQSMDGKSSSTHSTAAMGECEENGSFDTQPATNSIDQQPSLVTIPIAAPTSNIVERVLESNPLFEAFGCATTLLNDNSRRFGKITSLIFQISKNDKERLLLDEMVDEYSSTASSEDSSSCNDVDFRHERKDNGTFFKRSFRSSSACSSMSKFIQSNHPTLSVTRRSSSCKSTMACFSSALVCAVPSITGKEESGTVSVEKKSPCLRRTQSTKQLFSFQSTNLQTLLVQLFLKTGGRVAQE